MAAPPVEKLPEGVVIQAVTPEFRALIPKREKAPPTRIEVRSAPAVPAEQVQIIDMTTPEFQAGLKKAKAELAAKDLISSAKDFDELYANTVRLGRMVGTIKSSLGDFQASDLVLLMMKVRAGEARLDILTDTYGIRTKVRELMAAEALSRAKAGRS